MFTLDMIEIPISSAKADDNGAYISKGSVTKFYVYNENGSRTSHKDGYGVWYDTLEVTGNKLFHQTKYLSKSGSTTQVRAILSSPELSPPLKLTLKKNQGPFMLSRTKGQMARINTSTFLGTEMLPNQPVVNTKEKILVFSQRLIV